MDKRLGQLRSVYMSVTSATYNLLCALFLFVQDLALPDSSSYELTACTTESAYSANQFSSSCLQQLQLQAAPV